MRQIFTSQRVETVEGVAELLEKHGIETYISNGRSYHGRRGSQFSYSEPIAKQKQPTVWVRHADDQPKAREILRERGLLDTTRPGQSRIVQLSDTDDTSQNKRRWALRIRLVLLALIVAAAGFTFLRQRSLHEAIQQSQTGPTAAPPSTQPDNGLKPGEERIRIPTIPQPASQQASPPH